MACSLLGAGCRDSGPAERDDTRSTGLRTYLRQVEPVGRKQFDFSGTLSRVYKGLGGVRDKPGPSWDRGARFLDGYAKELSASASQLKRIRPPTSLGPAHARLIASVQAQRETYLEMRRILRRKDRPAYEAFIGRSTPDRVTEPAYYWVRVVASRAREEGIPTPPWLKAAEDLPKRRPR